MGMPAHHLERCLSITVVRFLVLWISCGVVVPAASSSVGQSLSYSKSAYAYPQSGHYSAMNTSASAFEPRDSGGGGGSSFGTTGGSYGAPGGETEAYRKILVKKLLR